jgi:hypothetical protein
LPPNAVTREPHPFQFTEHGTLPGLGSVVAKIPKGAHPVSLYRWFTLPHRHLYLDGAEEKRISPRDSLETGANRRWLPSWLARSARPVASPMPKFPAPPPIATLGAIPPQLHVLRRGETLWRIYSRGGRYPVRWDEFRSFGPTPNRFDHHLPPPRAQARAILYAASDPLRCAFEADFSPSTLGSWLARPGIRH